MARISLHPPRTVFYRVMEKYSRRVYGAVLDPGKALAHHRRVLLTYVRTERSASKWKQLDPRLAALAEMASAASVGCSWCMDFGYWKAHAGCLDAQKVEEVPGWRSSDVFTEVERDVMAYAEAVTATPPSVEDALFERLRRRLGDAAMVELTAMVALENFRSRTNSAFGITSQGFEETCAVPARH